MLDAIVIAAAKEEGGGSFLVSPDIGLMVWALLVFAISGLLLKKYAFPQIAEALDRRQRIIEDSLDTAAENTEKETLADAKERREELMAQTRRDIEAETQRAIQEIRNEVADLTILATEKITRKTLTEDDQRKLVEDTLAELDFSALAGEGSKN